MAHKFVVGIRGKVPYLIEGDEWIVTDNDDYTLELVPDSEWEEFSAKTVLYIYDNGKCILHPIEGNVDTIPVVQHSGRLHIGVTAGEIRTTTWVTIPIKSSARRKGLVEIPEPEPEVYDQIMELIDTAAGRGVKSMQFFTYNTSDGGVEKYTYTMQLVDGTSFSFDFSPTVNALKRGSGKPSGSGDGISNSPFWVDTSTGYLYNYLGQNAMHSDIWEIVRGRPQVTSGEGAPTTSTAGEKDDLYVDSATKYLYWCSGWAYSTTTPGKKEYTWVQLNAGSSGGSGSGDTGGDAGDSGTTALKASFDESTGELVVSGGTVAFDEDTGEMTIDGTPMSFDETTGEMIIGG